MKTTYVVVAAIVALLAVAALSVTFQSDDVEADVGDTVTYKLTYHAEIEGVTILDTMVPVNAGNQITVYAIAGTEDYTFIGWEYNGVVYKVGEKFTMPENDAVLNAEWESIILASAVEVPENTSSIMMIIVAIFAIGAIVAAVVVMKMRSSALEDVSSY